MAEHSALQDERILDHEVFFVFGCARRTASAELQETPDSKGAEHFAQLQAAVDGSKEVLWEDSTWPVSRDFLPRARQLFLSPPTEVHQLTVAGLHWANHGRSQSDGNPGLQLALHLRESASSRRMLGLQDVQIQVQRAHRLQFSSGISIAALQIKYALEEQRDLDSAALVISDCNAALGHPLTHRPGRLRWIGQTEIMAPSIMGIMRILMESGGYTPNSVAFQRVYLFTAISCDAATLRTESMDLLLSRIARKHTASYVPGDGYVDARGLLEGLRYSLMTEGAALAVSTHDKSAVRHSFLRNTVRSAYLPAVVAAVHEQTITNNIQRAIGRAAHSVAVERLRKLTQASRTLIEFSMFSRIETISGIAMHNEFYRALRQALSLDGAVDRLTAEVRLVEQVLEMELRERDDDKRRWLAAIGTAVGAFLLFNEAFEAGINLKWGRDIAIATARLSIEPSWLSQLEWVLAQRHVDEFWGVMIPVGIGIGVGLVAWLKRWTFPNI